MTNTPSTTAPAVDAVKVHAGLLSLLDKFDEAAQAHGWQADQGSRQGAEAAKDKYEFTKSALILALAAQAPGAVKVEPLRIAINLLQQIEGSIIIGRDLIPELEALLSALTAAPPVEREPDTEGCCGGLAPSWACQCSKSEEGKNG